MALRGLLRDVAVSPDSRFGKRDWTSADLIIPFVVAEEEELVFFDRSSDGSAVLPADEEGIFEARARGGEIAQRVESGRVAGAPEARKGGHIMVAEEEEPAAMQ